MLGVLVFFFFHADGGVRDLVRSRGLGDVYKRLKMFRIEFGFKAVVSYTRRMMQPLRLAPVRYAGRVVDTSTLQSVMVFVFLYITTLSRIHL